MTVFYSSSYMFRSEIDRLQAMYIYIYIHTHTLIENEIKMHFIIHQHVFE